MATKSPRVAASLVAALLFAKAAGAQTVHTALSALGDYRFGGETPVQMIAAQTATFLSPTPVPGDLFIAAASAAPNKLVPHHNSPFAFTPYTVGRRRLGLGASSYTVRWRSLDGIALDANIATQARCDDFGRWCPVVSMEVAHDVVTIGASYGLTDNVDLGATANLVRTTISGTAGQVLGDGSFRGAPVVARGTASGLGDTALTIKYRFWDDRSQAIAALGEVRLPTGSAENLLGVGATRAQIGVAWSTILSARIAPGAHAAYSWNVDRPPAARSVISSDIRPAAVVTYGATLAAAVTSRLQVSGDVIGRHLNDSGRLVRIPGPTYPATPPTAPYPNREVNQVFSSAGATLRLSHRWRVSANVLWPLRRAGLTPDIMPVAGVQWTP